MSRNTSRDAASHSRSRSGLPDDNPQPATRRRLLAAAGGFIGPWLLSGSSKIDATVVPAQEMTNPKELTSRVGVVTGSGRNIGRAIALALADGGAAVVINVRSNRAEAETVVQEIEARGGQAMAAIADIADPFAVQKMAGEAYARFGRIDFLINNAALREERKLEDLTVEAWRKVMNVTLDGAFHCVKACASYLKASGAGTIVNIGGLSAYTGAKNRAHVVAAKAGLIGLTRALACELAEYRVTANLVSPGLIATARPAGAPKPEHHLVHDTITGERGTPEAIADAVRFLCGPGARFITGQQLHVNGGAYFG